MTMTMKRASKLNKGKIFYFWFSLFFLKFDLHHSIQNFPLSTFFPSHHRSSTSTYVYMYSFIKIQNVINSNHVKWTVQESDSCTVTIATVTVRWRQHLLDVRTFPDICFVAVHIFFLLLLILCMQTVSTVKRKQIYRINET